MNNTDSTLQQQLPQPLAGEVHVWSAPVAELANGTSDGWALLSPAEQAAAQRLRRPADRARAVLARSLLRRLLASYGAGAPAELVFASGAQGKPVLAQAHRYAPAFNLSHSGDWLLLAVAAPGVEIGVDVEQHRAMAEWQDIAARHFHADEVTELRAVPMPRQLDAFFNCWTRKEAVAKATGLGLALDLQSFRVPVRTDPPVHAVVWSGAPDQPACTLLTLAPPAAGYSAALAVCGPARGYSVQQRRLGGA